MKLANYVLLVSIFTGLTACTGGSSAGGSVMEKLAEQTAQEFMKAVEEKDYEKAFSVAHKEFYATRSREDWKAYFENVNQVLGKKTESHQKNKINDSRLSGVFYMYEYSSRFDNGLGKEIVTLIQKINTNDPPLVFGYKIESSKLPEAHN